MDLRRRASQGPAQLFGRFRRLESARLARVRGVGWRSSFTSESPVSDRAFGYRPATVQHVLAERNEQSGPVLTSVEAGWTLAAHPLRRAAASMAGRNGITLVDTVPPPTIVSPR